MRDAIEGSGLHGAISASGFVVGRDGRGRWTALSAGGRSGGVFASRDAAIRYARSEAGRVPGAVRLTSERLELPLAHSSSEPRNRDGCSVPWRVLRRTDTTLADRRPVMTGLDRRWLAVDIGIAAGLAALCLWVAALLG